MNINDMVEVDLTVYGIDIYYSRHIGFPALMELIKDGKLKTQLWCLFETFGPYMHMGSKQIFVDNRIEIL